jgi:hypothetical protein
MQGLKVNFIVSDKYDKLIKKESYEPIILKIMNESKIIFPGSYVHILEQSNGESDYKNIDTGEFFDVKVLFSSDICHSISNKSTDWISIISDISSENYYAIMNSKNKNEMLNKIYDSKICSEYIKRLESIKPFEKCILFSPFPITMELSTSIVTNIMSSTDHLVIKAIKKYNPKIIDNKEIYIIYPNLENKIIIRKLFDGIKLVFDIEFLDISIINEYISTTDIFI